MAIRTTSALLVASLALTACASTKWQHTLMTDPAQSARQLVIDDGYCLRVALGSAPMPQVVTTAGAGTTSVTMSGTTINPMTGQTSYGTYSGQARTTPAGGFAAGMADGMNMGNAINAAVAQERIHKACMFAKGWSDSPIPVVAAQASVPKAPLVRTNTVVRATAALPPIYASPKEAWDAETAEFLLVYPQYEHDLLFGKFNVRIKAIAVSEAGRKMSGPQILMAAQKEMVEAGVAHEEPASKDYDLIRSTYRDAIRGDAVAQAGLGTMYSLGRGTLFPVNLTRAAFWAQQSAVAGNSVGQISYGVLRYGGGGVQQDKVDGYRWVQKAAVTDPSLKELMGQLEAGMSPEELRAVR